MHEFNGNERPAAPLPEAAVKRKRVCIADIVAMESELFLFDEPTASLDPLNAAILEAVLDKLGIWGKTSLISTHDVDFTWRWADRALVFSGGA